MTVDEMGVDTLGVVEVGEDEMGSRGSRKKPWNLNTLSLSEIETH